MSTIESNTAPAESKRLRFVGVQVQSARQREMERDRLLAAVDGTRANGDRGLEQLPPGLPPVTPVMADEAGALYLVVSTGATIAAVPLLKGKALRAGDSWNEGGLLALESSPSGRPDPGAPARRALVNAALAMTRDPWERESVADAERQGAASAPDGVNKAAGERRKATFDASAAAIDLGKGLAQSAIGQLVNGNLSAAGLGLGAAQQLVGMGLSAAMNSMWKVNDSSSMGEQLARQAVQEALGKLQGEMWGKIMSSINPGSARGNSTLDQLNLLFNGASSSADKPCLRVGDADANGNAVAAGLGGVTVNGLDIARDTDPVKDKGVVVYGGSATVLAKGMPVARGKGSESGDAAFTSGSGNVFVGGPAGGTKKPVAKPSAPSKHAVTAAGGSINPQSAARPGETASDASEPESQAGPKDDKSSSTTPSDSKPAGPLALKDAKPLSDAAYNAAKGDRVPPDDPRWEIEAVYEDKLTGFRAVLAKPLDPNSPGRVLAFAGTDSLTDALVDANQILGGVPAPYLQALGLSETLSEQYPGQLVLTGHSLGGGMTNFVGAMLGIPGTGINAATLGLGTQLTVWLSGAPNGSDGLVNYNNYEFVSSAPGSQYGVICNNPIFNGPLSFFGDHLLDNVNSTGYFICTTPNGSIYTLGSAPVFYDSPSTPYGGGYIWSNGQIQPSYKPPPVQ